MLTPGKERFAAILPIMLAKMRFIKIVIGTHNTLLSLSFTLILILTLSFFYFTHGPENKVSIAFLIYLTVQ